MQLSQTTFTALFISLVFSFTACKSSENNVQQNNGKNSSTDSSLVMYIEPVQCNQNPWEEAWEDETGNYTRKMEEKALMKWLADKGIEASSYKSRQVYEYVCEACTCPRGDVISVEASHSDKTKLKNLGFTDNYIEPEDREK